MRTYSNAKYASTNYTHNASATTARVQMVGTRKSQQAKNFWETSIRQPFSLKSLPLPGVSTPPTGPFSGATAIYQKSLVDMKAYEDANIAATNPQPQYPPQHAPS